MLIDMLTGLAVSGSVAAAACLLVRKAARGRLSARWEYRMVKLSLVFALAPLGQLFSRAEALLDSLGAEAPVLPAAVQLPLQSGTAGTVPLVPPAITAAPASPAPLVLPHWVLALAAGVWGLGALWMLARKLRARRALGRLVRSARPVTEETVLETLRRCREQLGLHQPVTLRASAAVFSPLVTGLVRPVILLPETALEPQVLRCLLLHELNHVRRRDLWVRLCSMAALVIHWYNPLFHMLDRTVREVGEERCDEDVAQLLDRRERLRYGRILLQMAAGSPGQAGPWALCLTSREALERRLNQMLHTAPIKDRRRLLALLAAAAVLACGTAAALSVNAPLVTAPPEGPASVQSAPQPERQDIPDATTSQKTEQPHEEPLPPEEPASPQEVATETAPAQTEETVSEPEEPAPASQPEEPAISQELQAIMETALRGDTALIVSRGGTLLPDDDRESYCRVGDVYYKRYVDKNGMYQKEYMEGNRDALRESKLSLLDALVDGVFPTNSLGESYGFSALDAYVGYEPDLVAASGTNGERGYVCNEDEQFIPHNLPASECPHEFTIPLYDSEHNVIGEFSMSCGGHFSGGMTIEEAKAALAAGEDLS